MPADEFRLLLAHEPDIGDELGGQRVGLQLSGHSHGGQVVLPGVGAPLLPPLGRRYLRGLCQAPTHPVYTSRGLGGVPPYLRLNCPPEVAVLTLTTGEPAAQACADRQGSSCWRGRAGRAVQRSRRRRA